MSEFEYKCKDCGHEFIVTHNIHIKYRNMVCPKCKNWVQVKRLLGTPTFIVNGYNARNGYSKKGEK